MKVQQSIRLLLSLAVFSVCVEGRSQTPPQTNVQPEDASVPSAPADPLADHPRFSALDRTQPTLGAVSTPDAAAVAIHDQFVQGLADPQNTLDLIVGVPRQLMLKHAPRRVQIPDENVAAYDLITDKEISISGKTVGTTVLNLWFDDPKADGGQRLISYLVRVFPDPQAADRLARIYQGLETSINKAFPNSHIQLTSLGENLVIRGTASDPAEANDIMNVISTTIPNAVVQIPFDPAQTAPANGSTTPTADNYLNINNATNSHKSQGRNVTHLINLLRVKGTNQVMLRVTVAEVNRSAARSIGLNFAIRDAAGNTIFQNTTGGLLTSNSSGTSGSSAAQSLLTSANLPMVFSGGQVAVALNALRTLSLAKSLAEPNLVAINGHSASFQAGGEFPVPVVTGATATGLQSVQFIPFGVQLQFTPYLGEKGKIRLAISASVSTRDDSQAAEIGNTSVPSLNTRNFSTTVDMRSGQSFAVAGLIQQNMASSGSHIPFFGDLPILDNLLGSSTTSSAEQELAVLVSADLVEPLDKDELPALPGHEIISPNDAEFYLYGRLESRFHDESRPALQTDWDRMARYQELQTKMLIGPSGYSDGRAPARMPESPSNGESK